MAERTRPRLETQLRAHLGKNRKGLSILGRILSSERFLTAYSMANAVAVGRLGYNDHGYTHVRIAAANALSMLNILKKRKIQPNFVSEKHGSFDDAQVIVMLGALFHDIGNAVHRTGHERIGTYLALPLLDEVLATEYKGALLEKVKLGVLECVYSSCDEISCTSLESGVVKVADGTDCEKGRARIPYRIYGKEDIHAISALAIRWIEVKEGREKPIRIEVDMSNPAGVFQVDNVLMKKISTSGISHLIEVVPLLNGKPLEKVDITKL